jgi:uncharacterized protein (DUF4415 family)
MKKQSTTTSSGKRLKVSAATRGLWKKSRLAAGSGGDAPVMPPEFWDRATIGKYYRPVRSQISVRIDNEVLDWLKSKGAGHLSRINEMLRERMMQDRHGAVPASQRE